MTSEIGLFLQTHCHHEANQCCIIFKREVLPVNLQFDRSVTIHRREIIDIQTYQEESSFLF